MTVIVSSKVPLVVPDAIRRKAGLKTGDEIEFRVSGGVINIVPKPASANDEYTPKQRRVIDTRLAEARKSPHHGPFDTADDAIKFLWSEIKRRPKPKTTRI
jgi:bifunctional DNA-binding transcriptional regulator/antitoxin component of YhaV-PrlF toxin-antitoxin module